MLFKNFLFAVGNTMVDLGRVFLYLGCVILWGNYNSVGALDGIDGMCKCIGRWPTISAVCDDFGDLWMCESNCFAIWSYSIVRFPHRPGTECARLMRISDTRKQPNNWTSTEIHKSEHQNPSIVYLGYWYLFVSRHKMLLVELFILVSDMCR